MITDSTKNKIQTIVSVFETSSLTPRYDILVCFNDGPGHCQQITFGKHQTTEFGNLRALIRMYCTANGKFAADLKSYIDFIGNLKHPLSKNETFKSLLKLAGTDQIMHDVQDKFFDQYYWTPAVNFFAANGFTQALSMGVIYDSYIHSGGVPIWLRNKFNAATPLHGGEEKEWIKEYVTTRDNWLEQNSNKILRNTDYRTDCWLEQIQNNNWDLSLPVECKFNSNNQKVWIKIP